MTEPELFTLAIKETNQALYTLEVAQRRPNRELICWALERLRVANSATQELERRSAGVPPAKIG